MAKILIVDDDQHVRAMLQQMLQRAGYDVYVSADGSEGLKTMAKISPDLVVTDLIMPEKEGIEFIRELRKKNSSLKIIAISGGSLRIHPDSQLTAAKFLGADLTFKKPIHRPKFLAGIEALLQETMPQK